MIEYGHFIGGKRVAGTSGRKQDVMQPMDGTVRGTVALASHGGTARRRRERQGGAAGLGRDQPAAPRARADEIPRAGQPRL